MREFKITEGQIKELLHEGHDDLYPEGYSARSVSGIHKKLKEWFPAAFEPEWEKVDFGKFIRQQANRSGIIFGDPDYTCAASDPLELVVRKGYGENYRIREGKLYRRKE
jgi:hypothetical protein